MKYTTPKGTTWEQTNILQDGQLVFTSDSGSYVVIKPDVKIQEFFEILGYGDPTDLEELIGEVI